MRRELRMIGLEKCDRIVEFTFLEAGQIEGLQMEREGGESTERINLFHICLFAIWIASIVVTGLSCGYGFMNAGAHGGRIEIFGLLGMILPGQAGRGVVATSALFSLCGCFVLLGARVGRYENTAPIEQLERLHSVERMLYWVWQGNSVLIFLGYLHMFIMASIDGGAVPQSSTHAAFFENVLPAKIGIVFYYVMVAVFTGGMLLEAGWKSVKKPRWTPYEIERTVFSE